MRKHQVRIERGGQELNHVTSAGTLYPLVSMGDHLFEDLQYKQTWQFIEKESGITQLVISAGQISSVWDKIDIGSNE